MTPIKTDHHQGQIHPPDTNTQATDHKANTKNNSNSETPGGETKIHQAGWNKIWTSDHSVILAGFPRTSATYVNPYTSNFGRFNQKYSKNCLLKPAFCLHPVKQWVLDHASPEKAAHLVRVRGRGSTRSVSSAGLAEKSKVQSGDPYYLSKPTSSQITHAW